MRTTKEQARTLGEKAMKSERHPTVIYENWRNVLRELEMGEHVFPDYENVAATNQALMKEFSHETKTIDFTHKLFNSNSYFSKRSLKLLDQDLLRSQTDNGRGLIKAELFIERYFDELCRKSVSDKTLAISDENHLIRFYSEHKEKAETFQLVNDNIYPTGEEKAAFRAAVQRAVASGGFKSVPSNLDLSARTAADLMVVVEGKTGEYFVVSKAPLKRNQVLSELHGEVSITRANTSFVIDKQLLLDSEQPIYLNVNTRGNISHYIQYTQHKPDANMDLDIFVQEGEGVDGDLSIRIFAKAFREIEALEKLIVYTPFQ